MNSKKRKSLKKESQRIVWGNVHFVYTCKFNDKNQTENFGKTCILFINSITILNYEMSYKA